MRGRPIDQSRWPDDRPRRTFFELLDQVHRDHGTKSLRTIASDMNLTARSRVSALLRGKLPADEGQVRDLIRALGGSDADVSRGVMLYRTILSSPPDSKALSRVSAGQPGRAALVGRQARPSAYQEPSDPQSALPPETEAGPGRGHDESTLRQAGIEVNITLPLVPTVPEMRYSLPPDAAAFTGRREELDQITVAVAEAAGSSGVIAVRAIGGMPGAGKTALAVHAAHMLRERFPDRQLFINLHAHTPGREPVRPEDTLAGLLAATGVEPRYLPGDLDGRAAMWRDRMAGQRALLVLDNAASTSQVAPLLPGGEGCVVLVTSRRNLGDLPGTVTPILLGVLPPPQAADMFTRLAPRAAGSPGQIAEVVELAGFLPLAISPLARVFARHPSWTLADLAAETRQGLLDLTAENDSVAAAFEMSYRLLDPDRQRFFCLLGLHPGATTDAYAAAALAEISIREAAGLLDGLHGEGLLTETGYRRYGMHDLLRRYARDHAANLGGDAHWALERLLDYYEHTATRAGIRLARQTRPGLVPAVASTPTEAPGLADDRQALAWARAERANLLACLDRAVGVGEHARVIALTAALAGLLWRDGPWADALTRHTAAIEAACNLDDRLHQANALDDLGHTRLLMDDYPPAVEVLDQALGIYRSIGDWLGQANALHDLGSVRRWMGDYPAAVEVLDQALGIYRSIGDWLGQANVLIILGYVRVRMGDYPAAVEVLEQALGIYRSIGDRLGQVSVLYDLGHVRRLMGDFPAAIEVLEQALGISRAIGDQPGQARTLNELGSVRRWMGDFPAAMEVLEQALGIYRHIGRRMAEAAALNDLGMVRRWMGDVPAALEVLEQALGIYRDIGHRLGEANVLNNVGHVRQLTGDFPAAIEALDRALGIYRDIGHRLGEANVLNDLGIARRLMGDSPAAVEVLEQALGIYRDIGDWHSQGIALDNLGHVRRLMDDFPAAIEALDRALGIYRDIGDRGGEAGALNERGELHRITGEFGEAEECHRQALELACTSANPWAEAHALAGLGRCAIVTANATEAEALLRRALEIFQRVGAADSSGVLAELKALGGKPSGG